MAPASIEILPYQPEYAESVIALVLSIQQREFGIPILLEEQPDLLNIPRFYQRGTGNFWVAISGDEVVGTVGLLDIGNGSAALRKMFVKASFRSVKICLGKRLLETLIRWCGANGIKGIYLGTTELFLSGHRFYERNGFREISLSQLPSNFPVMPVDTKFYSLDLGKGGV